MPRKFSYLQRSSQPSGFRWFLVVVAWFVETRSHHVALVDPELQRDTCLYLLNAGIKACGTNLSMFNPVVDWFAHKVLKMVQVGQNVILSLPLPQQGEGWGEMNLGLSVFPSLCEECKSSPCSQQEDEQTENQQLYRGHLES